VSIETRTLTSLDALAALGPRYDAMVLSAGDAGLFYQLGWLERVWPYYHARLGGSLRFIVAEQDDALVGLAPLVLRREDLAHACRRVLGFLGGTWDELDNWMPAFLIAGQSLAEGAAVMSAVTEAITAQPWDLLELRFVRDSCACHDVLSARFETLDSAVDRMTTPRARLDGGWAPYWAGRSKRLVRMLDRGRTRAAQDGRDLAHDVTTNIPEERRADIEEIHRARQQQVRASGRARSSPFEHPEAQRMFWSLMDWAAARGQLRVHWLRLDGGIAAYVIALHHAGTTFAYLNAIDPAAERYHPGSLVLAGLIEHEATVHGARVIDMMIGANLTKTLFATEELANRRLSVVNPRLRSRLSDLWIRGARAVRIRVGGG
jgi:hypothetical protein